MLKGNVSQQRIVEVWAEVTRELLMHSLREMELRDEGTSEWLFRCISWYVFMHWVECIYAGVCTVLKRAVG